MIFLSLGFVLVLLSPQDGSMFGTRVYFIPGAFVLSSCLGGRLFYFIFLFFFKSDPVGKVGGHVTGDDV